MATANDGPSWADLWGTGGVMHDENDGGQKETQEQSKKKPMENVKAGLFKAKAVASVGAQKVKSGTNTGFKWVKNQCQRKTSK